jgi:Spy/CpxP family protein refolding chaperone
MRRPWLTATVTLTALLLPATAARAADAPPGALYDSNGIGFMLTLDAKIKKELKITKEQSAAVEKVFKKQQQREGGDGDKICKMKGPDKDAKVRALFKSRGEEFLRALPQALSAGQIKRVKQIVCQQKGITLLSYPEIQSDLNMSEARATQLRASYDKLKLDMQKDYIEQMRAGKITREQANDRLNGLVYGIPEAIRAQMTADQRSTLADLLGPPYPFFAK